MGVWQGEAGAPRWQRCPSSILDPPRAKIPGFRGETAAERPKHVFFPRESQCRDPWGGGRSYFAPAKSAKSNQTRGAPSLIRFRCSARDQFFPVPEGARRILGVATEIRLALSGTGKKWSRAEQQEIRKVPVNPVWTKRGSPRTPFGPNGIHRRFSYFLLTWACPIFPGLDFRVPNLRCHT